MPQPKPTRTIQKASDALSRQWKREWGADHHNLSCRVLTFVILECYKSRLRISLASPTHFTDLKETESKDVSKGRTIGDNDGAPDMGVSSRHTDHYLEPTFTYSVSKQPI